MHRLTLTVVLATWSAWAQSTSVPTFELERLQLNPGGRHGLLVGAGDVLPAGGFRVSLTAHYEHQPLVYRGENGELLATIVGSRVTTHLAGAWAPWRWVEFALQIPVVLWQGNPTGLDGVAVASPQSTALGTPYLQARFALLRQENDWPVDLSLGVAMGFPLGSAEALTKDPTVSVLPKVGVARRFGSIVRVGVELGATLRGGQQLSPDNPDARDSLGSTFDVGVGATTVGERLRFEASLRSLVPFTRAPASAEVMLGARYPFGPVEVYAIAGPGFGKLPGTPVFRALLGVAWVGAPAPAPRCVEGTAYSLTDCPDADRDGDGMKNALDACPEVAGSAEAKGCPDRDRDGIVDGEDQCPDVKGPAALRGCPDSDADGVTDSLDRCPDEAGPSERQGGPAKDRDRDGVLDEVDACPDQPGPVERNGCPVVEQDGDGVADELDNCPKVAGPAGNQGCPKEQEQLVIITREKLVIKDKVYFDTAKSKIQPRSFGLLNQVARILVEHPDVQRVVVEGHTDSQGKPEANRRLSQQRADAVKAYLVKQGVEPARLEARGYGPDRPVADNATAAGREQNRRVEFVIATTEKVETKTIEKP